MTRDEIVQDVRARFKEDVVNVFDKSVKRVYIDIKPTAIMPMAKYIFKDLGARFNIASGVDCRFHMEILYHFTLEEINLMISLRVKLDKNNLTIDSLTPLMKGADWIEREIHEMLGVHFKGHPNLARLLLPDEWPQGVYPLRADYEEWDKDAVRDRGTDGIKS